MIDTLLAVCFGSPFALLFPLCVIILIGALLTLVRERRR